MPFIEQQIQELPVLALVFFMSMLLALALTPVADRLAWKIGLTDEPSSSIIPGT